MNLIKTSKDIAKNVEEKVEKSFEVAKDRFNSLSKHLPFVNFAKHSNDIYDIEIDLPGVKKEDIDIKIEDDHLNINAIRKFKNELDENNYYLCESSFGMISRSFALDDNIDQNSIKAKYEDGRLYLTFEKLESKKAKSINIK
jgi:HSP20 family protein